MGFGLFCVVSDGISCRAGSNNVSAVSGLSLGATKLTESACFSAVSGLVAPKPSPSDVDTVNTISAGISTSGLVSTSGRDSISGMAAVLQPPRTRDLRTMVVVSERLTIARKRHYDRRRV